MVKLTGRATVFRTAIAAFIEVRRKMKLKGKDDDGEAASKYDYAVWLAEAARLAGQIQVVTHVLKATHPYARGSSLHVAPHKLPQHSEIGSHVLNDNFVEDVVGNAAAASVYAFLKYEIEGKRLLEWIQVGDTDLLMALSNNIDTARGWMQSFASLLREESRFVSHSLAKQVYWLVGEKPQDDAQYHLLQPLFSSTLAHAVHSEIQDSRFGDTNSQARQAYRDKKPHDAPYRNYPNLVERHLGAPPKPTNKQKHLNVSHLNAERLGRNYLFSSLPPTWRHQSQPKLLRQISAMELFSRFEGVWTLTKALANFLLSNPAPTMETREKRETIEQALCLQLPVFAASIHAYFPPGWTRDTDCRLPLCEQLWLDPERIDLQPREGYEQDDAEFSAAYHRGDWPDEVAGRFANWVNERLRDAGLTDVGDAEYKHWAKQAIVDAAWPVPAQRRAPGGAA